jgi:glycosyltransferase involved in cell wall biosynthesis
MTAASRPGPKISVIIPTYNDCGMLGETLRTLARQRMDPGDYEVIVADDGSADATRAVTESFSDQLAVKYCFQEDLGFRAGAARNAGARLAAAPILAFADTGIRLGPDFLRQHLDAHTGSGQPLVVLGYTHGYNPTASSVPDLGPALDRLHPEEVVALYDGHPAMQDLRHDMYWSCDLDLSRLAVPWGLFFSCNCSMRADDYWGAGGFDESFVGWGGEDLEFGYRLFRLGLRYRAVPGAWGVETPAERDMATRFREFKLNMLRFVVKHPEPCIEIGWGIVELNDLLQFTSNWETDYQALIAWSDAVKRHDVSAEIEDLMRGVPAGDSVAVIGAGGDIPATRPVTAVMDFDENLLARARNNGPHLAYHSIGLRTPLPDKSVDSVIITSRLSGLRDRWNDVLLAEARRIGYTVLSAA